MDRSRYEEYIGYVTETVTHTVTFRSQEELDAFMDDLEIPWDKARLMDTDFLSAEVVDSNFNILWSIC